MESSYYYHVGTLAANAEISLTCLDDGKSPLREPGTRVTMMQCQWGLP